MFQNKKSSLDDYLQEVHSSTAYHKINPNPSASPSLTPQTRSMQTQLDRVAHELNHVIRHTVNAYLPPQPNPTQSSPPHTPNLKQKHAQ